MDLLADTILGITPLPMAHIQEADPGNGEDSGSLLRSGIIRFERRIDPASITANAFYLIANGEQVPGHIEVSPTELFATFFPSNSLSASTAVRVVVEGDGMRARDGWAMDADGDRVAGGRATLQLQRMFPTNDPAMFRKVCVRFPAGSARNNAGQRHQHPRAARPRPWAAPAEP